MFELTNRELASAILIIVFAGVYVLVPSLRRQIGPSFAGALKAFFAWKILFALFVYLAYAFGLVYAAWRVSHWDTSLLKDTLIVVFFVGLPMVFRANKIKEGANLFRNVVRDVAGVSALLAFYVGFGSLALWAELLLQPVAIFLGLLTAIAYQNPAHRAAEKLASRLLAIIGIALLGCATMTIASSWNVSDLSDSLKSLALSIWLPLAMIPFVYTFAYVMYCESALAMLPFFNNKRKSAWHVRVMCVLGLRFSTRLASELRGRWLGELAQSSGFTNSRQVMKRFRQAVKRRDGELRAFDDQLEAMTEAPGAGEDGLQLDRREFHATKQELLHMSVMQMGWYRNRGAHYRPELLGLLGDVTKKGLPADHGIQLVVRKDKQAWQAWRKCPNGWYFGIGGTRTLEHQWQYDGATPPAGFPSDKSPGWVNASLHASSPEWAKNDEPPNRV